MKFNLKEQAKKVFESRSFRAGTYSVLSCIVLGIILIVINLLVNRLPAGMTEYDITNTQLFTISEESKEIAAAVDTDITAYLVVETGGENNTIVELLKRYTAINDKIQVQYVDPAVYIDFTKQYTEEQLEENSLIMVGNGRYRIVNYSDMFQFDLTDYYTSGTYITTFNGEGMISSALDYLCKDELPLIYSLSGHGEPELSDTWVNYIKGQNTELETVNLLTSEADITKADCIIINAPTADYTNGEIETIRKYLEDGGRMMLITDWVSEEQPNLMGLMEYYGCEYVDGIVIEGNANYCLSGYPHYLVPDLMPGEITEKLIAKRTLVCTPAAHGIRLLDETRSTLVCTPILNTSADAYAKVAGFEMATLDKEEGDIDGPFSLGVAISEDYFGTNTKIVWFSASTLLDPEFDANVAGGNSNLVLSAFSWMLDTDTAILSFTKNVGIEALIVPSTHKTALSVLFAVVIPLSFLVVGFIVWLRRRKK